MEDWGDFVELEVVLSDGQDTREGFTAAQRLMAERGIAESRLIEKAYIDPLLEKQAVLGPAAGGTWGISCLGHTFQRPYTHTGV